MEAARIHGSRIRLISKAQIRYEGTLSSIDPEANTVSLKNVRVHGTESRPAEHHIAPSDALFDFIVFGGSDIKDLTVYEPKPKTEFVDPAVVQSQPARGPHSHGSHGPSAAVKDFFAQSQPNRYSGSTGSRGMYDQWSSGNEQQQQQQGGKYGKGGKNRNQGQFGGYGGYGQQGQYQKPEKSYMQQQGGRTEKFSGGKKGGHFGGGKGNRQHKGSEEKRSARTRENPLATHTGMNFKVIDDQKASEKRKMSGIEGDFNFKDAKTIDMSKVKEESAEKAEVGYDKKKSFFDSLSCETTERQKGEPTRMTKLMRENNHKQDIETFGADAVTAIERSFTRKRGTRAGQSGDHSQDKNAGGAGGRGFPRGRGNGGKGGYSTGGRGANRGANRGRRW